MSIFIIGGLLTILIFLQMPQEIVGLSQFRAKSNLISSPSSTKNSLNILTILLILVYFVIALLFDIFGERI